MAIDYIIIITSLLLARAVFLQFTLPDRDYFDPKAEVHFLFLALAYLMLHMYFEFLLDTRPNPVRLIISTMIFGSFLILYIRDLSGDLIHENNWIESSNNPIWKFPIDLLQLFVNFFVLMMLFRMRSLGHEKPIRRSITLLIAGFLFFYLSSIEQISEWFLDFQMNEFLIMLPGFIILLYVALKYPTVAYASPVHVYRIIIVSNTGETLIEVNLQQRDKLPTDQHFLLGGVTHSLNSILNQLLENPGTLSNANLSTVTIMVETSEDLFVVLEVEKETVMLRKALKTFINHISSEYFLNGITGEINPIFHTFILKEISYYFPFSQMQEQD
ncbi:MAG: hypothetical protein ACXAD7_21630 [Candidatus Kariarchaeaceae archaeon]